MMSAYLSPMRQNFPSSDHCDGQRFFNPGSGDPGAAVPVPVRGLSQALRWRLQGRRATWPRALANAAFAPPPAGAAPGTAAITFINHASFLIRLPGLVVLTDPIFSQRCSPLSWAGPERVRPPGIPLTGLPRPDLVLLSHNHYDHMDLASLRALRRLHAPRFVTMLGNAAALARLDIDATELDWWQETTIGTLRVTATPARHFAARTPFDRNRTLWGGFMLHADAQAGGGQAGGGRILFAGDSGAGSHWREIRARLGDPDVALLPIGAYEPRWFMAPVHMNPAEAVQAHRDLGARRSVGMHFGTFQLTDEAIDAPLLALEAARVAAGLDSAAFATQGFGETRVYDVGGLKEAWRPTPAPGTRPARG